MATTKVKISYVALIVFLMDSAVLEFCFSTALGKYLSSYGGLEFKNQSGFDIIISMSV